MNAGERVVAALLTIALIYFLILSTRTPALVDSPTIAALVIAGFLVLVLTGKD